MLETSWHIGINTYRLVGLVSQKSVKGKTGSLMPWMLRGQLLKRVLCQVILSLMHRFASTFSKYCSLICVLCQVVVLLFYMPQRSWRTFKLKMRTKEGVSKSFKMLLRFVFQCHHLMYFWGLFVVPFSNTLVSQAPSLAILSNAGFDGVLILGKLLEQDNCNMGFDAAKGLFLFSQITDKAQTSPNPQYLSS